MSGMKKLIVFVMAMILLTSAAFAATTAVDNINFTIDEGELSIVSTGSLTFANLPLNDPQFDANGIRTINADSTSDLTYVLTDARGTGAGWHMDLEFSNLQTPADSDGNFHTQYVEVAQSATTGQTITADTTKGQDVDATNGPKIAADIAFDATIPPVKMASQKMLTTAVDYGMGKYTYVPKCENQFRIRVHDANAFAGVYSGTVTATIVTAP